MFVFALDVEDTHLILFVLFSTCLLLPHSSALRLQKGFPEVLHMRTQGSLLIELLAFKVFKKMKMLVTFLPLSHILILTCPLDVGRVFFLSLRIQEVVNLFDQHRQLRARGKIEVQALIGIDRHADSLCCC